jgi:NAD(P)-dependent dehydrogenase (short-subunit alcohol dehydrogenase family)
MSRSHGWTASDIPSQHGRLALITGGNAGIGLETAYALAGAGAAVILAGRNADALDRAAGSVRTRTPGASVETVVLDLADLASVRAAADTVRATGRPLDLLVNNAGVMAVPERRTTKDGFELTFGTNHYGHFALTGCLLPALLAAPRPRVITVSAMASRWKSAELVDLGSEQRYAPMRAYAKSKLANVVFSAELGRRAQKSARTGGPALLAVAVHPGTANTGIQRNYGRVVRLLTGTVVARLANTPEQAALPTLYAAARDDIRPGAFYGPTGFGEGGGAPGEVRLPAGADDPALGSRLWDDAERATGVRYAFG